MKLRQFEETAFEDNDTLIAAMNMIADESNGAFTGEQLKDAIEGGTHLGFYYCTDELNIRGVIVVTKVKYADGEDVMTVVGAAGDSMGEWEDANSLLNELAQAMKCKGIEIKGRRGFVRMFKQRGWKEQYTSIYRPVSEEG